MFVEQPGNLPAPPAEGRVAVVDVAFAGGENYQKSTVPFLEALGDRLAIWVDHHEHPVGWSRFRDDPRFVLVPNRIAHADFDGLLSAVKFLRGGAPPWPEADEDARAADSPGRGHAYSPRARRISDALEHASAELRSAQRDSLRQQLVEALVKGEVPPALQKRIDDLARAHEEALAPVDALAAQAREEARGVLVARVAKALPRPVKKALLSRLEERAPIGVVVEGRAVTAATFRDDIDLSACDELAAGRSDYRFGQADDEGRAIVSRLGALVRSR